MKNYLKIFAPIGLAILLGSLTFVFAQTKTASNSQQTVAARREAGRIPPPPFGFAPRGINPRALEQIGLTDEQKTQIGALLETARAASQVYFEKLWVVEEKIKDTTESETFDEAEARKLLKTKGEIQMELEIIRLKTDSAVYNLLTAEQIAQLDLIKSQRPLFSPQNGMRMPPPEK
jgi:Spy/CpxP family protein refolding chaperone